MVGWEEGELVDEEGDEVVDAGFLEGFEVGDAPVSAAEGFAEGFVVFGGYGGEERGWAEGAGAVEGALVVMGWGPVDGFEGGGVGEEEEGGGDEDGAGGGGVFLGEVVEEFGLTAEEGEDGKGEGG